MLCNKQPQIPSGLKLQTFLLVGLQVVWVLATLERGQAPLLTWDGLGVQAIWRGGHWAVQP